MLYRFLLDYSGVERTTDNLVVKFDENDPNYEEFRLWALENLPDLPDKHLDDLRVSMKKNLAERRYNYEVGGVEFAGLTVKTDRESQFAVNGAYTQAKSDPDTVMPWKGENGFALLDAGLLISLGDTVYAHVQKSFLYEMQIDALINEASEQDLLLLDIEAEWNKRTKKEQDGNTTN